MSLCQPCWLEDGFEMVMGTNYFGQVYLTELLLPQMLKNSSSNDISRVIFVTRSYH